MPLDRGAIARAENVRVAHRLHVRVGEEEAALVGGEAGIADRLERDDATLRDALATALDGVRFLSRPALSIGGRPIETGDPTPPELFLDQRVEYR